MLEAYFPILIFIGIGLGLGCIPLLAGRLLGPQRPDPAKLSPYECGFVSAAHSQADIAETLKAAEVAFGELSESA